MKILFVTNQLEVGGIETNLVRLTRELAGRGHEITVASAGGPLVREIEDAGGQHLSVSLDPVRSASGDRDALDTAVMHADVVHVFSASAAIAVWRTRFRRAVLGGRRPPVVSSIMGLVTEPGECRARIILRAWATTIGVDLVLLIAPSFARLARRLPVRRRRLRNVDVVGIERLVPDEEGARALRGKLGIEHGAPVVTTIGRLTLVKQHELFIAAAPAIVAAHPGARLLIVGEGPDRARLAALIESHGLQASVLLVGERRDIAVVLTATDVYVRPGLVEGFVGITLLEAQMLAVPVVAFATEDGALAVQDGTSGRLVANNDVAALAGAVVELLADRDLARTIGHEGKLRAKRFAIDTVADGLERVYREVVSARRR